MVTEIFEVSNFAFAESSLKCTVLAHSEVLYLELRRGTPPEGMARLQDAAVPDLFS